MKKKNKKGFTLIELLAVIVILSLLIALAIPSVVNLMNKAKYNAFKLETESLLKIAEVAYVNEPTEASKIENLDGLTINCYELEFLKENGYTDKNFKYPGAVLIAENSENNGTYSFVLYKTDDYKWMVDLTPDYDNEYNLYSENFSDVASEEKYDTILDNVTEENDICTVFIIDVTGG